MKNVLWVEDEKDQYNCFSWALHTPDYKLYHVKDFRSAVEKIKEIDFSIFIIDIILPSGLSGLTLADLKKIHDVYYGIELIKTIRSAGHKCPILVVSVVNEKHKLEYIKTIDKDVRFIWKYDTSAEKIKDEVDSLLAD